MSERYGQWVRSGSLLVATAIMTVSGGMACPVPDDADSAYHTLSRLRQLAPKLGVERASPVVQRDSGQAHACEGGVAEGFACNNVDLMSFTPLTQLGGGTANDIWGWTDALTGKEYALLGKTGGTAFVDISDPVEPLYLGTLPTHTQASTWRDIKVHADHAFIVSEAADHGMQVFDLTQLRGLTTPQNFVATTHYDGFGAAHNIAINTDSGFAYAVGTRNFDDGCAGGLHMVDISTPTQPQFAGCYSGDGYTHDAQCVIYTGPDSEHQGKEICFNYNEDTLTIVDVTNKATPVQLARVTYFGSGYTHQGWVTEDQAYLLLDDETDELAYGHNTRTYIWDIGDLDAPVVSGSYLSSVPAIDHNQYIRGSFAFQANYRAGLRILDISNIASGSLVENGYFDTYPGSDGADFDGSWSVYPYFPSGHVIVSGIDEGLFVLEPTALEPGFMLNTNDARLEQCGDGISSTFFTVDPVGSYNGAVSFAAAGAPPGVTIGFTPASVTPPANFIVAANVAGAQPGLYPVTITATDGELGFDQTIYLELSQQLPATPQLLLPATNAKSVSAVQTLYWNATPGAFHYDLDIATDPAFTDVVLSVAGLQQNSYAPVVPLPGATGLYWRVRAFNACGSQLSATRSFTTAPGGCELFPSSDVPIAISPVGTGTVISNLQTAGGGIITDVNVVGLQATHTWISDIDIRLEGPVIAHASAQRHPERPTVLIMAQSCNNEDNLDINFDDDAAPGALPCPPTDGGTYQPANPLAAFSGVPVQGDWNLLVTDNFAADGGSLDAWGLEICTTPTPQFLDTDGDGSDDTIDNCTLVANAEQRDTDADGFGNRCDPDLNNDGNIDFADLVLLKAAFFASGDLDTDFDGDGATNFVDLNIMKTYFFSSPGPSSLVPSE